MKISTKAARALKVTGKVGKNLALVTGCTIVSGILMKKSKDAALEVGEGFKQIYNIVINSVQRW